MLWDLFEHGKVIEIPTLQNLEGSHACVKHNRWPIQRVAEQGFVGEPIHNVNREVDLLLQEHHLRPKATTPLAEFLVQSTNSLLTSAERLYNGLARRQWCHVSGTGVHTAGENQHSFPQGIVPCESIRDGTVLKLCASELVRNFRTGRNPHSISPSHLSLLGHLLHPEARCGTVRGVRAMQDGRPQSHRRGA